MKVCAIAERKILLNVTNMNDRGTRTTCETSSSGVDEMRDAKGVQADPTPTAAAIPMVVTPSIEATSDVDGTNCGNRIENTTGRKDRSRWSNGRSEKSGIVNPGGDSLAGHQDDAGDPAAKKRKTRRGKPKHRKPKPYPKQQMSYDQKLRCRGIRRLTKTGGQPPAPYNTTQFLMEDHSDLPDLEQKLADVITSDVPSSFQKPLAPPRTRDSSFSVDSEEDYFYSSPEDEEEFLTKEFSSAYEDLHAERLNNMSKSQLIQEYVQLEAKLDIMSKRMRGKSSQPETREGESKNRGTTTSTSDNEAAKKLKICQQRIDELAKQNEQLRRENETLKAKNYGSPGSSVDSESDSDSTSNRSSCSCSGQSERRRAKRRPSVDSDGASTSTTSSTVRLDIDDNKKSLVNDHVNGITTNHEIDGLPT